MSKKMNPICARCPKVPCNPAQGSKETDVSEAPGFCPMKLMPEIVAQATAEYEKPEVKEFARLASIQEFECYERTSDGLRTKIPRVEELIQFAAKCGYKNLGIAFCAGLANEARILTDILENKGFEVVSVRCKVGATPKEKIGIREDQKIWGPGFPETMCSPIVQAEVLNASKVDLAIMMGLCIGHDTLFLRYCKMPVTVIAVKDRVFGHNPLAALYLADTTYYGRLKSKSK